MLYSACSVPPDAVVDSHYRGDRGYYDDERRRRGAVRYPNKQCKYFARGYCRNGERCTYLHYDEAVMAPVNMSGVKSCRYYLRGYCREGDRCKYLHHIPSSHSSSAMPSYAQGSPRAPSSGPINPSPSSTGPYGDYTADGSDVHNNYKGDEVEGMCCICLAKRSCVLVHPCRHLCLCQGCAAQLRQQPANQRPSQQLGLWGWMRGDNVQVACPVCRRASTNMETVFLT